MTNLQEVDVSKMDYKEKLAYLYGVSVTRELYDTFLNELVHDLVAADPEQLTEIVNNLRTAWAKEQPIPSENKN